MPIKVEPNKNILLVFSLLNRFNLVPEDKNNPIRTKTIEHFKEYNGAKPDINEYIHSSKLVVWALSVSEAPNFDQKIKLNEQYQWDFNKGNYIKQFAIDFYNKTDFEDFYNNYLLNVTNKMKFKVEEAIQSADIETLLNISWESTKQNNMVIIPNPLTYEGFGPEIGDTNYQVISAIHRDKVLHKILHEGSHPKAKEIQKPYLNQIDKLEHLLKVVMENKNYPQAYNRWRTCFEEHLVRAVQIALLNPKVIENFDEHKMLEEQRETVGMLFIDTFYTEIKEHGVKNGIPRIIDKLKLI